MLTLGIETSCDETSVAVINDQFQILSNVIISQIEIHQMFGGVVPEIAARNHIENILPVLDEALHKANPPAFPGSDESCTTTKGLLPPGDGRNWKCSTPPDAFPDSPDPHRCKERRQRSSHNVCPMPYPTLPVRLPRWASTSAACTTTLHAQNPRSLPDCA